MRILHTADIHLKKKEHLSIVESIIHVANKESVDLIIIAGDLFDAAANGRVLENALLPIWEQFYGDILIVPGNHDVAYLKDRTELAANVIVANEEPFSVAQIEDIYFVCVPYQSSVLLSDINIPQFPSSILITHGTYNARNENTYFPIASKDVCDIYNYVALGHYHTWFEKWERGTLVVNPGAPRQTRKSDKGARFVAIIDTETWKMERVILPVVYNEYSVVNLSVVDSSIDIEEKLLFATKELANNSYCEVVLSVQGSVSFSEYSLSELIARFKKILNKNGIDVTRIHWNLDKITQISPQMMYASFTRLLVDKITDISPHEIDELAPFLFERLQQENQNIL
ncbi:MAG: metallophosphoesterase family protein [Spirochaetota bacterium]|nr:metallophosphoesterase family protein [Spirochaetota bacterium]